MSFKKFISATIFISFLLIFQGILFDNGDSPSIKQLKYSFITLPRTYSLQQGSRKESCCSGFWGRLRSFFGSCFGSCSKSEEEEEVESLEGRYSQFQSTASGFTLHAVDLTLTCEKEGDRTTTKTQNDLRKLFDSYGRFICTEKDLRPACKELFKRIKHQTKKLNKKGMGCQLFFSNGVFSID
ncbi:signal peptide-containing protein [Cryptosporidium hominis]